MNNKRILLTNAHIVNEGKIRKGSIAIQGDIIHEIFYDDTVSDDEFSEIIDLSGNYIFPGVIDDQVHFRDPGLTHKADIESESKAAVAGGVTSFMEMPNTNPQTVTVELLEEKFKRAEAVSYANYSFYIGATNNNLEELQKIDIAKTCGVKVFMGSSTGNMLVDNPETLKDIFKSIKIPVAVHCEDEQTIQRNIAQYKEKYGDIVPVECHPEIRSEEACYLSSSLAVELAKKYGTRLHVLHLSTEKELSLFDNTLPLAEKKITAEVCVHHLWFNQDDYKTKGSFIRWNPAVKKESDRKALFKAMKSNVIDVIATDHAPHLEEEKHNTYFKAMSGGPLVQHSLLAMLDFYHSGDVSLEHITDKMCHSPAILFNVKNRGFIRKGYYADLVVVDLDHSHTVTKENILYKCNWSPFEGHSFKSSVQKTFVNGVLVYDNGSITGNRNSKALEFQR